jgi:ethanolamine utilization protein EutN
MRIAEVIGKVTLSQCHPSLRGARWLLAVPLTADGLRGDESGRGEAFVVFDERGASAGAQIAVSEGAEAAAPFHPQEKPIDAYNAAILDYVSFE